MFKFPASALLLSCLLCSACANSKKLEPIPPPKIEANCPPVAEAAVRPEPVAPEGAFINQEGRDWFIFEHLPWARENARRAIETREWCLKR